MGGAGGSSYTGRSDPEKLKRQLRRAAEESDDREYEAQVGELLRSLLTDFNDRDVEAINRHLEEIKAALERDIDAAIELNFGGSVAKHTYVDGLSDIDTLVLVDGTELGESSPRKVKEYIAGRLRERFPNHDVKTGRLAVTIEFSDAEIQLLPAIRAGDEFRIADAGGEEWSQIDPAGFMEKLTEVNKGQARKVVPAVKLAKGIIASLPEQQRITGYHAESLAIEAFDGYESGYRLSDMLKHYFRESEDRVLRPITDTSGQSVHVDEYLGPARSLERRRVSDAFSRVRRRMRNADRVKSVVEWAALFDLDE